MKPFSLLSRYELSKMTLREIADSHIYEIDPEHFKNYRQINPRKSFTPVTLSVRLDHGDLQKRVKPPIST